MQEEAPHLILLDLMMPEMDGFEFVAAMREHEEWRAIPVVVVTAKSITEEDRRRLNGCVENIVQKGHLDRKALLHEVRHLISLSLAEGENMYKILLVEDNEMNRDMLSRRLVRKGYQVVMASDGLQGIEMAKSESPNLILMDMSLPVIDGWDATRELKAAEGTNHIPIIALTAHAMASDRDKAFEAGCDDFDTKPIEWNRLLEKIQSFLT